MKYGNVKLVDLTVEEAENRLTAEMKKVGFGLVSRINMKEKFKEKLDVEFGEYLILGFCNPPVAYEAVQAEPDIGLLLPCNAAVYERDGRTCISLIKPTVAMSVVDNSQLIPAAESIEEKLQRALDSL